MTITKTLSASELVLQFIERLNSEDFEGARVHLAPDFVFEGVMGKREGADIYINEMKGMKFKYKVHQVFQNGNDVCLWYDINIGGKQIFAAGWYSLNKNKIESLKIVFDPRPLL